MKDYNYTITSSEGESAVSFTFEVALEHARKLCNGTNKVATISCNKGHFKESYKWDFEMDDLVPC